MTPIDDKPRVLVVDDEPFYAEVLGNLLRDEYSVTLCQNGEQLFELLEQGARPDIILLDIVLPGMDGYEACRRLKSEASWEDIPVIFLTVKRDVEDELRGFQLGAVDYITKPISPPIVKARVRTHVKMARLLRQLETLVELLRD